MSFYCYMLECKDGSFYTGWTNNLEKRLRDHNSGKGARYTRSRLPVTLVYFEDLKNRADAMKREREIKKMNHKSKLKMVDTFTDDH